MQRIALEGPRKPMDASVLRRIVFKLRTPGRFIHMLLLPKCFDGDAHVECLKDIIKIEEAGDKWPNTPHALNKFLPLG
ncbi:hypothetical protein FIBSPDRAFT_1055350 [Athelia psychrophila]|uniref:Uncharacterized protein n=1 Tax=Athelia psychrophila TaxID=1759441 RepID=A0A167TVP0_9AGAM|nr:hypothetical protein FIBSPDRAFT_1055350 [Fibularhizoctonia sp. CBS 109695]